MNKKIFICHSSKNKKEGDIIFNGLKKMGIKSENIFYSSSIINNVPLNEDVDVYVKEKIKESDLVIALLSRNFYESKYTINELSVCWAFEKRIMAFIIDNVKINENLGFLLANKVTFEFNNSSQNSYQILQLLNKELEIDINQNNLFILDDIERKITYSEEEIFKFEDLNKIKIINKLEKNKLKKIEKDANKKLLYSKSNLELFLNQVFSSKEFINALILCCENNFNYENVTLKISNLLNYYLLTRNLEASFKIFYDVMNSVNSSKTFIDLDIIIKGITNDKNIDNVANKLLDNFLYNGYVTHACNPLFKDDIISYGFDTVDTKSDKIYNLEDLEKLIYKNKFLNRQNNVKFYYTLPSPNAIHYAINMSPERVFNGPLKQLSNNKNYSEDITINEIIPIIVGESARHYYRRVAKNNIDIVTKNNYLKRKIKKMIKKKMNKLVNDFCYDYSYLLLIPTNNGKIPAYNRCITNDEKSLEEYIKENACGCGINISKYNNAEEVYNSICKIIPKAVGVDDETMMGNLCSNKAYKDSSNIIPIKLPSYFTLLQYYLKRHYIIGKKVKIRLNPYVK